MTTNRAVPLRATPSGARHHLGLGHAPLGRWSLIRGNQLVPSSWQLTESAFEKGSGIVDLIMGRSDDYGAQLDWVIREVLVQSLKVTKPFLANAPETIEGALEREAWIREKLQEALWNRLPDDVKRDLAKVVETMLKEKGVDSGVAARVSAAILSGGLSAARAILGFQFHILAAQLSNLLMKILVGRGLSLVGNALLQRVLGALFGPVGWVVTGILLVPTLIGLIWPREIDKYLPAVFLLASARARADT